MNILSEISHLANCDLCGEDRTIHSRLVASGRQMFFGESVPITVTLCKKCGFISQSERFSDGLLSRLYEADTSFAFGDAEEDIRAIQSGVRERQEVISRAMISHDLISGASVLDVGGGRGEISQHLIHDHRVVVADTTESPPIDPRIEKVGGLFSERLAHNSYDVVVMNHVLEHVFSPTILLNSAWGVLKENGLLICEVPFELYTPLVARHLGDWRHVGYFSRHTMRRFLEKSGFSVRGLTLETGAYGARRLPVIRAVAQKNLPLAASTGYERSSIMPLLADMISPAVLTSLLRRILRNS